MIARKKGAARQRRPLREKPASIHKDTRFRVAGQLLNLFKGRTDKIGVGDSKEMRPQDRANSPLRPQEFAEYHLKGIRCFAIYPMLQDDTVWCSCVDFDNKPERPDPKWRVKATKVYKCLKAHGIRALVEVSQSGCAAHVWLLFDRPIAAWLVRVFWYRLLKHLKIPTPEVFPRQDTLAGKKVGNMIRLPLFNKSHFVAVEHDWKEVPLAKALAAVVKTTTKMLKHASHRLSFELTRPAPGLRASKTGAERTSDPGKLPHSVFQLLLAEPKGFFARRWNGDTAGLTDRSRSALVWSIACNLIRCYVPTDDVEAAIRHWCAVNGYEKGERDDWITTTIEGAYKWMFNSAMTWRRLHPSGGLLAKASGPIAREFRKQINKKTRGALK
jgi:hypothetical protein